MATLKRPTIIIEPAKRKLKGQGDCEVQLLLEKLAEKEYHSVEEVKKEIEKVGYMYIPKGTKECLCGNGLPIYSYVYGPDVLLGRIKGIN